MQIHARCLESAWAVRHEGALDLVDTMGQGELEVGGHQLLDVRTTDVLGLLNLDNAEDLLMRVSAYSDRPQDQEEEREDPKQGTRR